MKNTLLLIAFTFVFGIGYAQTKTSPVKYDAALAKKLGADDYGMKKYVMAFLSSGPTPLDSAEADALQKAHLKNIVKLADEGKLIIAGPFMDKQKLRGIFIFNVETVEEARKLTETDPMIQKGVLALELHPWYGSASLIESYRIHKTIEKHSVAE
jgi:uncharacterized protein YciI